MSDAATSLGQRGGRVPIMQSLKSRLVSTTARTSRESKELNQHHSAQHIPNAPPSEGAPNRGHRGLSNPRRFSDPDVEVFLEHVACHSSPASINQSVSTISTQSSGLRLENGKFMYTPQYAARSHNEMVRPW
jgi:hypothetical protein